jgi:hypothetical protein
MIASRRPAQGTARMIVRFADFLWCRIAKPTDGSVDPLAGELRNAPVTSMRSCVPRPGDAASGCRSAVLGLEIRSTEYSLTRSCARTPEILDSKEKIPTPPLPGETVYDFRKDDAHERGIWRRAPLASYRTASPGLGAALFAATSDATNTFFFAYENLTTPATLGLAQKEQRARESQVDAGILRLRRHAAVHQAARRRELDGRVRRSGQA